MTLPLHHRDRLRLAEPKAGGLAAETSHADAAHTDALVSVVDDDPSIRRSLVRFFRSAGFAAEAYESARAYLARPAPAGPSCVVLDVRMPELDGLELQHILIERARAERIIFLTGQGDISICARAMKAGAVDFLSKPFADDEMLSAVQRALARSIEHRLQAAAEAGARMRIAALTPREAQVLAHVVAGKLNKQIAAELGTSIKTVKVQRGHVMKKMGVDSVVDLLRVTQLAGAAPLRTFPDT